MDPYTPTGDDDLLAGTAIARLTITADCDGKTLASTQAIYSTRQPVTVAYIKADGTPGEASAIALDGHEAVDEDGNVCLAAGWYFVGKNISYDATLTLDGDVNLILVDGKTMKVRTTNSRDGISAEGHSLHIYGQTEGTGALNAQTKYKTAVVIRITNGTLGIHGGNVNANAESTVSTRSAIRVERTTAGDALVIDRGTLTASSNSNGSCGIYIEGGDVRINGGQVTATGAESGIDISDNDDLVDEPFSIPGTLTLSGGTLTASSFDTWSGESCAGTLAIAPGHTYTDGTSLYDSTTETATLAALGGKTLQPCLALADAADNNAAIDDHAGQTLAVALSGRTLYKDGAWNTLCLPFDVSTISGTLSGDGVQAMTLNTETSNLTGSTLTLNFTDATGQTIAAGTPFIIRWGTPDDNPGTALTDPVFSGVTIDNSDAAITRKTQTSTDGTVSFKGTYASITYTEENKSILFVGGNNSLYWPTADASIGAQRAYFELNDGQQARNIVLNFFDEQSGKAERDNDNATGISLTPDPSPTGEGRSAAYYTLDGRKLSGTPTAPGIYVKDGHKVAIKREK